MTVRFRRAPDALWSELGSDVVALNISKGLCFTMEEVTARVWRLLEEPLSVPEICEVLLSEYEVDEESCRADVEELVEALEAEELVIRA